MYDDAKIIEYIRGRRRTDRKEKNDLNSRVNARLNKTPVT